MPILYKNYPPNWKEIRSTVLERANHQCEHCGLKNKERVWKIPFDKKMYWFRAAESILPLIHYFEKWRFGCLNFVTVVLTIAHLDHDETNFNVPLNRLAALCQRCHLRYDVKEKARRRHAKKNK